MHYRLAPRGADRPGVNVRGPAPQRSRVVPFVPRGVASVDSPKRWSLGSFIEIPKIRSRVAVVPLGALVIGTPLLLGGAPAWTVPASALLAALALVLVGVETDRARRDPLVLAWLLLVAVTALQLLPLPPGLVSLLDSRSALASARALEPWRIDRAAAWRPLHHDPGTGLSDLVYLLGLGAAYLAAVRAASRDGLDSLLAVLAASPLLVAFLGLAHKLTDQDALYAFYRPRVGPLSVLSPLLNVNHLAALTGAGAILWLGWALSSDKPVVRALRGCGAALCGAVCALSLSRGGVAAATGGVLLFLGLRARNEGDLHSPRTRKVVSVETVGAVALGGLLLAVGWWVAAAGLSEEYLRGDTSKLDNFRRALSILRGHELLGVGSGALPVVAAGTGRLSTDWTFLRVESLPIDLALSVGVPATVGVLWLLGRALHRWLPHGAAPPVAMAAWAALVSLLAHDLFDFSLFLGGTGYFAAVLAGLCTAWAARRWRRPLPHATAQRPIAFVLAGLVALLGMRAVASPLETERDAVDAAVRASPGFFRTPAAQAVLVRHPADAYLRLALGAGAAAEGDAIALRFVSSAMRLAPDWAQPHLVLARIFAASGRRSQSLVELREALHRSSSLHGAAAQFVLSLSPLPPVEALDRIAPQNVTGQVFLERVAEGARDGAYIEALDAILLRRWPGTLQALQRRANAALAARDSAAARGLCARLRQQAPREAAGYLCAAQVLVADDHHDEALQGLQAAASRVVDPYPLHSMRARLLGQRRQTEAMRQEMGRMLETAGSDLPRLVATHAQRAELEASLGNDRGAYAAYELAHALTAPDQPYLLQMAVLAARLGDRHALDAACTVLMERSPPPAGASALCVRSGAGDAGAAVVPGLGGLLGSDAGSGATGP